MNLSFHIRFNGQCREAFEYYEKVLGGKIGTLLSFENSPASGSVPSDWQDKIVHANIDIGGVGIAGDDALPDQYKLPEGFYILLGLDSEEKTRSVFKSLSDGGTVLLSLRKTFWSPCYGIVVDRFGVPWKLNCVA